jgi:hypothetical protein
VTEAWRKLYNEELHKLYSHPNIIMAIISRRIWVGHVMCMGEPRNAYTILGWKPEGKISLRRPRRRWKYNVTYWVVSYKAYQALRPFSGLLYVSIMLKRIIRKWGLQGVDWIHTAQHIQVTGSCEDGNEPPGI